MAVEVLLADSPNVTIDSPVAGQTTVVFSSLTYTPGTNELFGFHNGMALVVDVHYTESGPGEVILLFLPDDASPDVDTLIFQTIVQGSSAYIPSPIKLTQVIPDRRPNNFGGQFVFDP